MPVLNKHGESLETGHNNVDARNVPVLNDGNGTLEIGSIDGDKTRAITSGNVIDASGKIGMVGAATGRMGTRPIPTALYDIIGTFKSLKQNEYAYHVKNNDWPLLRKRLWPLRFHDHIIRNETELKRIRRYIEDNPRNWAEDDNNPEELKEINETHPRVSKRNNRWFIEKTRCP